LEAEVLPFLQAAMPKVKQ